MKRNQCFNVFFFCFTNNAASTYWPVCLPNKVKIREEKSLGNVFVKVTLKKQNDFSLK